MNISNSYTPEEKPARPGIDLSERDRIVGLINENVTHCMSTFSNLLEHADALGRETSEVIDTVMRKISTRLNRPEFYVAIIGEVKAGKSTFLNAVLGDSVLSTAKRESTATVTYLRYASEENYEATLMDGSTVLFQDIEKSSRDAINRDICALRLEIANDYGGLIDSEKLGNFVIPMTSWGTHVPSENILQKLNESSVELNIDILGAEVSAIKERLPNILLKKQVHWLQLLPRAFLLLFLNKRLKSYHQARLSFLKAKIENSAKNITRLYAEKRVRFIREVNDLTDMNGQGKNVSHVNISFPATHLNKSIVLMDTPGVNTTSKDNEDRAWQAIADSADACLLVTNIRQPISESTKIFISSVKEVTPHILLVMTKVDELFASTFSEDKNDLIEELDEARRTAESRFSKEIGRPAQEIFSIAVAAREVLVGGEDKHGLRSLFKRDLNALLDLLDGERALAINAYAALAARKAAGRVSEYELTAKAVYEERLKQLEEHKLPSSISYIQTSLSSEEELIRSLGVKIAAAAQEINNKLFEREVSYWSSKIYNCETFSGLKKINSDSSELIGKKLKNIGSEIDKYIFAQCRMESSPIEIRLHEDLKSRFRILESIVKNYHTNDGRAFVSMQHHVSGVRDLHLELGDVFSKQGTTQVAVGLGGAAIGAAIGSFIPGLGTLVGAGIGGLVGVIASLFESLESVQDDSFEKICETLEKSRSNISETIAGSPSKISQHIRTTLTNGFTTSVNKYQSHIDGLIAEQNSEVQRINSVIAHLVECVSRIRLLSEDSAHLAIQLSATSKGLSRVELNQAQES